MGLGLGKLLDLALVQLLLVPGAPQQIGPFGPFQLADFLLLGEIGGQTLQSGGQLPAFGHVVAQPGRGDAEIRELLIPRLDQPTVVEHPAPSHGQTFL